ncbi:Hypothetical protein CINCED_3A018053 [Cinara cedri]|uniref:Uncharacterized protein n=1 Tax=Cinara cedri TaxID=506608 RepID=A0A5E4NBB6_9HEMI|nr:Hypothetical protein CINCED_3A018053 [Cinara cedri]
MLGFRYHFVRRFFRRIMKPMTVEEAQAKKLFLSKAYFSISILAFCTVLYQVKQGRLNWLESEELIPDEEVKISPAFQYARMLNIPKATIVRMKGAEVLNSKDYNKETFNLSEHIQEEESSPVDPHNKFIRI